MDKSELLAAFFTLMAFNGYCIYLLMKYIDKRLDKIEQRLDFINSKIPAEF
jgi:hypothetical protein